ncbi:MAG: AAA family ATPase [Chloroflexota bacterium]
MSQVESDSYSNSPILQDNLVLGSFRLLFWLFFHPAAWNNHIKQIDLTIRPDFSLTELPRYQWKNGRLWRVIFQSYLAWPFVVTAIVILLGRLANQSAQTILINVVLGISLGLAISVTVGLASSVALGVPVGISVSLIVGLFGGQLLTLIEGQVLTFGNFTLSRVGLETAVIGLAAGLSGGLAFGVALGITPNEGNSSYSLIRQISGVVIGILIGIGGGLFASFFQGNIIASFLLGLPFGLVIFLRSRSWRRGLVGGLLVALPVGIYQLQLNGTVNNLLGTLAFLALFCSLFAVPYALAERFAGAGAGALAGGLGSGAGILFFLGNTEVLFQVVWFGLAGILLGLTLAWWRPVVMYPFLLIWNNVLNRLDEGRAQDSGKRPLFRYHSAFWDEYQRLPLLNLDSYLTFVLKNWPIEGEKALAYLSSSHQRWAAQSARIELDAQQLEGSKTLTLLGQVYAKLSAGELEGLASPLLRSFSRISQDAEAAQQQESAYNQRLALNAVEDRLDGLLRELTRSSEPYALRFHPIAEQWRQLVASESLSLAEEAELKQEIDSPYIIGVPLTEQQEIFVGRTDISARIEQLILDKRQPPLLLYGQRRVGKTSLLNNLGRLLPSTIVPMFVDLQGPATRSKDEAGFLYNLARSMTRSAERQRRLSLPPLTKDDLLDDPFTCFEDWLDEVDETLESNVALLMLDEFEVLEQMFEKGRFDETVILGMIRHLIQHRLKFKVLLSGSHTLKEFQRWSSYLINVQVIHVGYLSEREAFQLIESPVVGYQLKYSPDAIQRLFDLTAGHPFLIQLLCAEVVAMKNEQVPTQRRLATLEDVNTAVPHAIEHGSFFFADIEKNQVDLVGLEILRFIAKQGEFGAAKRAQLVEYFPSLLELENGLADLQSRELITQADDGYRFEVELIRRWFE